MAPRLPLPTLLSHVLVAYTIEVDNEAERLIAHRTSQAQADAPHDAPWLVSYALWAGVLQHVSSRGVSVEELRRRARTRRLLLGGLQRWRYVTAEPPVGQPLRHPPQDAAVVRLTPWGEDAGRVWSAVEPRIEERWRARFGRSPMEQLEHALETIRRRLNFEPPSYLPVIFPTQGGRAEQPARDAESPTGPSRPNDGELASLLSAALFAFTLDFEAQARIALSIGATTLRVLPARGERVRELPRLTGVSKEANAMCAGWLERHGCVEIVPDPEASRGKLLRLTTKGARAQQKHDRLVVETEAGWVSSFRKQAVSELRAALEHLVGEGSLSSSPLAVALEPVPGTWRSRRRQHPDTLPHYPMVLHRGGFPDGS